MERWAVDAAGVRRRVVTSWRGKGLTLRERWAVIGVLLPRAMVWLFAIAAALLVVAGVAELFAMITGSEALYGIAAGFVLLGLAGIAAALCWTLCWCVDWQRERAFEKAWLSLCRCPACTYDLSACGRDGDGVATCPECAGRWRV